MFRISKHPKRAERFVLNLPEKTDSEGEKNRHPKAVTVICGSEHARKGTGSPGERKGGKHVIARAQWAILVHACAVGRKGHFYQEVREKGENSTQ